MIIEQRNGLKNGWKKLEICNGQPHPSGGIDGSDTCMGHYYMEEIKHLWESLLPWEKEDFLDYLEDTEEFKDKLKTILECEHEDGYSRGFLAGRFYD